MAFASTIIFLHQKKSGLKNHATLYFILYQRKFYMFWEWDEQKNKLQLPLTVSITWKKRFHLVSDCFIQAQLYQFLQKKSGKRKQSNQLHTLWQLWNSILLILNWFDSYLIFYFHHKQVVKGGSSQVTWYFFLSKRKKNPVLVQTIRLSFPWNSYRYISNSNSRAYYVRFCWRRCFPFIPGKEGYVSCVILWLFVLNITLKLIKNTRCNFCLKLSRSSSILNKSYVGFFAKNSMVVCSDRSMKIFPSSLSVSHLHETKNCDNRGIFWKWAWGKRP